MNFEANIVSNVLFIGAHPDDVELGCGGAIMKHLKNGDEVYIMVVTDGEVGKQAKGKRENRLNETIHSLEFAGVKPHHIFFLHLPDTELWQSRQELLDGIWKVCEEHNIQYVYTHTGQSYHQDHVTIFEETIRATKSALGVFAYETNGGTRSTFSPNVFVDIEDVLSKKLQMLKFFTSQSGKDYFDPSQIEALSRVRAAQSKVYTFAEAFELVRLSMPITPSEEKQTETWSVASDNIKSFTRHGGS